MRVILQKDVRGLGQNGQIVTVSDGYARNYLFPRGMAKFADEHAVAERQSQQAAADQRADEGQKAAQSALTKLAGQSLAWAAPADELGHLYAGLKESAVLARIKKEFSNLSNGATLVDYAPIKTTGAHEIVLYIPAAGTTKLTITVTKT